MTQSNRYWPGGWRCLKTDRGWRLCLMVKIEIRLGSGGERWKKKEEVNNNNKRGEKDDMCQKMTCVKRWHGCDEGLRKRQTKMNGSEEVNVKKETERWHVEKKRKKKRTTRRTRRSQRRGREKVLKIINKETWRKEHRPYEQDSLQNKKTLKTLQREEVAQMCVLSLLSSLWWPQPNEENVNLAHSQIESPDTYLGSLDDIGLLRLKRSLSDASLTQKINNEDQSRRGALFKVWKSLLQF